MGYNKLPDVRQRHEAAVAEMTAETVLELGLVTHRSLWPTFPLSPTRSPSCAAFTSQLPVKANHRCREGASP
jgi:hypothetical protein